MNNTIKRHLTFINLYNLEIKVRIEMIKADGQQWHIDQLTKARGERAGHVKALIREYINLLPKNFTPKN